MSCKDLLLGSSEAIAFGLKRKKKKKTPSFHPKGCLSTSGDLPREAFPFLFPLNSSSPRTLSSLQEARTPDPLEFISTHLEASVSRVACRVSGQVVKIAPEVHAFRAGIKQKQERTGGFLTLQPVLEFAYGRRLLYIFAQ